MLLEAATHPGPAMAELEQSEDPLRPCRLLKFGVEGLPAVGTRSQQQLILLQRQGPLTRRGRRRSLRDDGQAGNR